MLKHNLSAGSQPPGLAAPTLHWATRELALVLVAIAVIFSLTALLAVVVGVHYFVRADRTDLVIIWGLALVMAHTSLVGIWWARSAWPSHAKTFLAVCGCATLWCLLIALSAIAEFRSAIGAAWAVSLTIQLAVSGILALLFERQATKSKPARFSILFLFIWTSLVAVLLGVGRRLAESMNWSAADVVSFEFFLQLQFIAIVNALFAVTLLRTLRVPGPWPMRIFARCSVALVFSLLTPAVMKWAFANPGGSYFELFSLMAVQGLVLLSVLIPLQSANDWPSSTATPKTEH